MGQRVIRNLVLMSFFALGMVALNTTGQAPDKAPAKKGAVHGRGRVAPKNLANLRARSEALHRHHLKRLPKATAATYDCRNFGLVPPIVDQKNCGSCWDFSGTCVVECALIKATILKNDGSGALSEQYTLDCYQTGKCSGDDNTTVLDHAKSIGLPLTSAYGPYEAEGGKCKYTSAMTLYKIAQWGFAGSEEGVTATQDIKNSMVAYGPIGCAVAAGGGWWDEGTGTDTGTSRNIDHDVVLVAWDDNHDNGDGSKGAWLMRNSWGLTWGGDGSGTGANAGYGWMKYGADSIGTESVWASASPPVPTPGAPVITSSLTAAAVVGQPFTYQITASNAPTSWNAAPLPSWATLSTYGIISGTPLAPETDTIVVSAVNASGPGTATLALTVTAVPAPPSPGPTPPPPGSVSIVLTPQQIASINAQSGSVQISWATNLSDLLDILEKERAKKNAPPCTGCPPK